ncbi:MAG: undecaprenyl-phosphate glucose phosphotransferase [Anaerolineales bacterium]|nr:undecaprenyl-phosphate glucose phosphotransferase [Anaerolineales bacterium]
MKRYRSLLLLLLLDVVLINVAFGLAYYLRYIAQWIVPVGEQFFAPYSEYFLMQAAFTGLMLFFLYADGAYTSQRGGSWLNEVYRIISATTTAGVILLVAVFLLLPLVYSRLMIIWVIVLTVSLLSVARLILRWVRAQLRRRGIGVARVLIVGAGELGRAVVRTIAARADLGYRVVGFIDDNPSKSELGRLKNLGALERVEEILREEPVDEVIITLPWMYQRKIAALVRACEAAGVRVRIAPDVFQLSLSRLDVDDIGGIPLIGIKEARISRVGRIMKRVLDIVIAIVVLTVMALPMALVAWLIRLDSPGPALFRQTRVGERGRTFTIYKFRSMREGAEEELEHLWEYNEASGPLFKIRNDPRQTRLGRLLRRTSFDELPQFFNVLRGEMSVVGPRPALPHEVEQYLPWQRQRLEVQPGITGLSQVSGRSDLTFDESCLLDIYYIENWSLALDLTIMLRTIPRVIFGNGAY